MKNVILRTLVSLFFLGWLFYSMRDDIPQIIVTLKNIDRKLFIFAVLIFLSTVLILARRLQLIFAAEGLTISLAETCNLTFVGYFFNNFLPSSVGGDIVKAMCATRITKHPVKSVTSVLMDRILGLFTFIIIPSFSVFFLRGVDNPAVPMIIYSFLVVSIMCFFLIFNRKLARHLRFIETLLNRFKLGEKVRKIYDGLHNFKNHKLVVCQAMFLSILGQSVGVLVLYLLARALGAHADPIYFFITVPVVHLISMAPSLGGLGVREKCYVIFLTPYIGEKHAFALGILWLALLFFLSLIGGMIYLFRQDYHIHSRQKATIIGDSL